MGNLAPTVDAEDPMEAVVQETESLQIAIGPPAGLAERILPRLIRERLGQELLEPDGTIFLLDGPLCPA